MADRLLSRREAATRLGVGITHFDEKVRPHLRVVRSGRRVLVPEDELERWIREKAG